MKRILSYFLSIFATLVFGLVLSPIVYAHAATLYVSNGSDNTVSVIDPSTGDTTATITVGSGPRMVVTNGKYVYVANSGGSVSVIKASNKTVVATISLATEGEERMVLSPDGTTLYVSDLGYTGNVYVINTASNTLTTTLTGFSNPQGMAINSTGTLLYVVNQDCCSESVDGYVSVLSTIDYSTVATIPVGLDPTAIALTPDGTQAYVTNSGGSYEGNTVSVINTVTNTVSNTITVGINPYAVTVSPDGTLAYVLNTYYWAGGDNQTAYGTVSVINTTSNSVVDTIQVGYVPDYLALNSNGNRLYVTQGDENKVAVINTKNDTVIKTLNTGNLPWGIAFHD